ncbi:hypothetical protein FQA39_LY09316 [Lamprigera yunnana]|nr:hypothetical protein FQA39_LY09316 [Lamprigera yunnana]
MFGPAVLPYLQASQPMPPTNEIREEKIVLPEDNIEVNDIGEIDEEAESHANFEGDELVAATEELEILGNDADAEVDVVRDKEINIDPKKKEKTRLEERISIDEKEIGLHGAQQPQYILDAITAFLSERTAPRPKFSGHIMEDPEKFLKDLEGYFNAQAVPKWRRLETALTEDAAAWWKTNQYFAESYEDFEEMLLDNYDSKEVWDQLSAQLGRRNKSTTETMAEFLGTEGHMFGPAVLPYLQASQPMPPTNEIREEKIVLPEDNIEVNDIGEIDEEAESHANFEGDELVAATEELEILGNDADAEVDVVRDKEINIDPEEDETVEEEIIDEVILDKVASVIVGQDLEPLDHAVPVVLGDPPYTRRQTVPTRRGARTKRDARGFQAKRAETKGRM